MLSGIIVSGKSPIDPGFLDQNVRPRARNSCDSWW